MRSKFEDTGFARVYLWTAKAKYTMGILYLACTLVYLFFGAVSKGEKSTLDFFTAIEMMFCCFFIGIAQQGIVPMDKLTKPRCAVWIAAGFFISLAFSLLSGWFSAFPLWCLILFHALLALSMAALLLGHFIELHRETKILNQQLEKYQSRSIDI